MTAVKTMTTTKIETSLGADVQSLMVLLESFGALLAKETAALKAVDFATVESLQEQKREYARGYQAQITALAARQAEISLLDLALREKLVRTKTAFTLTLKDNLGALDSARNGAKRLVNRILDVARKTVADECQTGYSAKGHTQTYKTSTLSLRVDQQL